MNEIIKNETIDEGKLSGRPAFYESMTDNPVAEIVRNNKKVFGDILRFRFVRDISVTIAPGVFDPFLFEVIPTTTVFEEVHNIKSGIPFVIFNVESIAEQIVIPAPKVTETTFRSDIINYSEIGVTTTIRVYIYELIVKR